MDNCDDDDFSDIEMKTESDPDPVPLSQEPLPGPLEDLLAFSLSAFTVWCSCRSLPFHFKYVGLVVRTAHKSHE